MSIDTATEQGRLKRLMEIVEGYFASQNWRALIRLVGLTPHDFDYTEADHGEAPAGARW
jgi:hypothetical protein